MTNKICIDVSMAGLDGHPRVYRDIFPSITAREHKDPRMIMEVITYEIPQKVRVRKYPVDCIKLCETLREYKEKVGLSNRKISEQLNLPITKVEHWFRKDSSFAIPDEYVWFEIKKLMNIETTEFDESIMTFEEKEGVFEKGNRIYDQKGISPTITCGDADLKILERVNDLEVRQIGNCMENRNRKNPNQGRVYDQDYLSPTLTDMQGGGRQPMIVAMRGRNPDNPSDRTVGSPTEQRLEPNSQGICNTLTSVQKDNMVLIKQATQTGFIECEVGGGWQICLIPQAQPDEGEFRIWVE